VSGGFDAWQTYVGGTTGAVTAIGAVGSSPNNNAGVISAGTLTLEPADATHPGLMTSGTQSFGGAKTFDGGSSGGTIVLGNSNGAANARVTLTGGNTSIFFSGGSDLILFHPNGTASFKIQDANSGDDYLIFDSTNKAINIPRNFGLTFPATLVPTGTTQTVDWTTGSCQTVSAASTTGTLVLTFSNPVSGGRYILKTIGKTGRLWTFPGTVKTAGGTGITPTATDGAIDVFEFVFDGTSYLTLVKAQAQA
jgi:hypothetical protein